MEEFSLYSRNTECQHENKCRKHWPPSLNGTMSLWTWAGFLVPSATKIPGENIGEVLPLVVRCTWWGEHGILLLCWLDWFSHLFVWAEFAKCQPLQRNTHGQMTSPSGRWGGTTIIIISSCPYNGWVLSPRCARTLKSGSTLATDTWTVKLKDNHAA